MFDVESERERLRVRDSQRFAVLHLLDQKTNGHPHEYVPKEAIAETSGLERVTLERILADLEQRGLVRYLSGGAEWGPTAEGSDAISRALLGDPALNERHAAVLTWFGHAKELTEED